MNTLGHIEAMNKIFFSNCPKFYTDFENAMKLEENVDGFEDNCIWTCRGSFCQLWKEYMW